MKAADELQAHAECTTLAIADGQTKYGSVLKIEACDPAVTIDTCSTAALAVDTYVSDRRLTYVTTLSDYHITPQEQ